MPLYSGRPSCPPCKGRQEGRLFGVSQPAAPSLPAGTAKGTVFSHFPLPPARQLRYTEDVGTRRPPPRLTEAHRPDPGKKKDSGLFPQEPEKPIRAERRNP